MQKGIQAEMAKRMPSVHFVLSDVQLVMEEGTDVSVNLIMEGMINISITKKNRINMAFNKILFVLMVLSSCASFEAQVPDQSSGFNHTKIDSTTCDTLGLRHVYYYGENNVVIKKTTKNCNDNIVVAESNFDSDGLRHGVNWELNRSGGIKYFSIMNHGAGQNCSFYENGLPEEIYFSNLGRYDTMDAFFCNNGQIYTLKTYTANRVSVLGYYCNGLPRIKGEMVDEKKDLFWTYWDQSGKLTKIEYYKNGILKESIEY